MSLSEPCCDLLRCRKLCYHMHAGAVVLLRLRRHFSYLFVSISRQLTRLVFCRGQYRRLDDDHSSICPQYAMWDRHFPILLLRTRNTRPRCHAAHMLPLSVELRDALQTTGSS